MLGALIINLLKSIFGFLSNSNDENKTVIMNEKEKNIFSKRLLD